MAWWWLCKTLKRTATFNLESTFNLGNEIKFCHATFTHEIILIFDFFFRERKKKTTFLSTYTVDISDLKCGLVNFIKLLLFIKTLDND